VIKPLYCADRIGVYHAVIDKGGEITSVDDAPGWVRNFTGICGYKFKASTQAITKRPHADVYCAGCKGIEEREAKQAEARP
jgi:hypothetical protein